MLLQLKTDAEKKIVNEVVNNTVITKGNFLYQIRLLSEASLGGKIQIKISKKFSRGCAIFSIKVGVTQIWYKKWSLSRNIFVFIFEDTDELENKD